MSDVQVSINHEKLIRGLDKSYPKLDIRNSKCPDFSLSERELFFKLGQRSVVENLLAKLEVAKLNAKEDM